MRKLLWVPITVIASILLLEGIWFNRVRQEYQDKTMIKVEKLLSVSIGKELTLRDYGYPEDPQNHRFVYKVQDSLPAEARMTGDTLNVDMLAEKHIGKEFHEIVQQISQDLDIDKGKYLLLSNLDSIFRAELETEGVNVDYRLSWYDHDTTAIQTAGTLSASHSHETSKTRLFPIGTRGLQFVDAEVDIHLSLFMKQMLYLLLLSGVLAVVVMGCVVYLLVTIRRKNRLFRQREASVNGTVHDLKAPLNSIVALMGLLKRHVTAETDRALIEKTSAQARSLVGEIEELLITARRDRQRLYIQKKGSGFAGFDSYGLRERGGTV